MIWRLMVLGKNCRKVAGGLFGTNLTIEEDKVEFPKGKDNIRRYDDPETTSGTPVQRYFCQTCGVYARIIASR